MFNFTAGFRIVILTGGGGLKFQKLLKLYVAPDAPQPPPPSLLSVF